MAKRKKGMSAEEKRAVMLDIFYTSQDVFNMKELIARGSKAGVNWATIEDIVKGLVDDRLVETDKIGSGNFYWAFPSRALVQATNRVETLRKSLESDTAAIAGLEEKIAEAQEGKEDTPERSAAQSELDQLRARKAALEKQLAALADSDPVAIKALESKARELKLHADRWTDNIWRLKSALVNSWGKDAKEVDVALGIDDKFDYVK